MSLPVPANTAPVAVPSRIGQGTAVEQSRAVAEVQAAVIVAQQCPRDVATARTSMQASCQIMGLAEKAFYRYARAGSTISGASVHLARELARCWGNVQYGITELRRDDEHGQSEMQAWAWDVQTNSRSSTTFIVPHARDKKTGPEKLTDLRDVYENNANMGARRLREVIFSILPPWFTEEAKDLCNRTLADGDGKTIEERSDAAIKAFAKLDVTLEQIERKIGRPRARWNQFDIAQLSVAYRSIERGEVSSEDEFPPRRVTVADLVPADTAAQTPKTATAGGPVTDPPANSPKEAP